MCALLWLQGAAHVALVGPCACVSCTVSQQRVNQSMIRVHSHACEYDSAISDAFVFAQVTLHTTPMYFMVHFEQSAEKFFIFLCAMLLGTWATCYMGACSLVQAHVRAIRRHMPQLMTMSAVCASRALALVTRPSCALVTGCQFCGAMQGFPAALSLAE